MNDSTDTANASPVVADGISARTAELLAEQRENVVLHTDKMFAWLMTFQWFFSLAVAIWVSPLNWSSTGTHVHAHIWGAIILGAAVTVVPVLLGVLRPGLPLTRHVIAIGQMVMSALLIHLTGGRIESHFHIFGSLAILAFYRDSRVLLSASVVVFVDQILRGIFWPESIFGVANTSILRALEHVGWVIFEVAFLVVAVQKSLSDMQQMAERQAKLESVVGGVELTVAERTADLRRSEEQLLHAQKMEAVGRLAGGVAHDFNNVLTVICGYCALSLPQLEETNPLHRNMTEIQKAAERARGLTGQLLAFSRKQVLQPRVLNLNDVVQGLEKMLRRLIGEDVNLCTNFQQALGCVKADPGQLEQVIMNLVVNARDAMPRGGKLTINTCNVSIEQQIQTNNRTLKPGDYVMLAITDDGMGMTEEVQSHLFEPFFTTKGMGKGTGLGLATSHGIICQSGGEIHVYSELNVGTTFKIYLPRTDATTDSRGAMEAKFMPKGSEAILVVEDDPAVRALAVLLLRQRGYQVQESSNAFEALELIRKSPPFHLVLSDVIMPQMSGKSLCDEIMRQRPYTRVLLMSGYTDDALAHHGVLDEGLSFLEKPFSPAQLTQKVRDVLDAPHPRPMPPLSEAAMSA